MRSPTYVVITPVRNEEEHLRATIDSMVAQTAMPCEWIIVDDGSTDATPEIIREAAQRYSWLHSVSKSNRGFRKAGGGVVDAFSEGYRALRTSTWEFVVKLDGDLEFSPDYFQCCLAEFANDSRLGIGGGIICYLSDGKKTFETAPAFHVRGATKIYRKQCWDQLGGLLAAPGWDTMDEIKANSLGWTTRSFPGLHLVHRRPTGSADGVWPTLVKYGRANFICGYHPLFMVAKCLRRLLQKPYFVGGAGIFYGYMGSFIRRVPRVDEPEAIAYLRRQQWRCLLGMQSIWK